MEQIDNQEVYRLEMGRRLSTAQDPITELEAKSLDCRPRRNGKRRHAARGTDERPYPWGMRFTEGERCNDSNLVGTTTPVDEYADGRSFYEVWDMAGNVYEWCRDSFDDEYYKNTVRQPIQVGLRGAGTDDTWWLLSGDTGFITHNPSIGCIGGVDSRQYRFPFSDGYRRDES